jgi:signal transduction histidine kinase
VAASTACETTALLAAVRSGADALCRLAAERDWASEEAEALAAAAARAGRVDLDVARAALCSRTLGDARLQTLPPRIAAEALVRVFVALAPVHGASLWVSESPSPSSCAFALGEGGVDGCARAAEAALGGRRPAAVGDLLALPVRCWQTPAAALVVRADAAHRSVVTELADDAVAALAAVLEREALLERGRERERLLVESSERRLARLAFDIHDGPLQTVAALGLELGLLGSGPRQAEAFQGAARVRELQERVAVLEAELRELTHTLEPTTIARRPLAATLADQVAAFGTQHGVAARLAAAGDLTGLSPSQRIALVRVVNEALTNARDHGGATEIHVEVRTDRRGVHASVVDNGCGFEVGQTLPAAARKGRLGLVGMSERVRLLGGRLDVESRAGGPTTITASLPWWNPVADAAEDGAVSPLSLPVAAVT